MISLNDLEKKINSELTTKINSSYIKHNQLYLEIDKEDLLDVVLLCHAGLAQDSPELPSHYLNQILNLTFGYLTTDQRKEVEEYLADKKYLPPLKLHLPNS